MIRRHLFFFYTAVAIIFSASVQAQKNATTSSSVSDEEDATIKETIVVTGTKRRGISQADLAVPVDVISAEDLQSQNSSDFLDVISSLVPSYNVAREPISDVATFVRPASLRGLPSDSALILLNGKRRHRSASISELTAGLNKGSHPVDLVPIVGIGIKQVEVLRDGASAQYGSDAIAGVLNFRLADDPSARKLAVQVGSTYEGDGDNVRFSGLFGTPIREDGFAVFAFELNQSDATSRGEQDPAVAALAKAGNTGVPNPSQIWGAPEVTDQYKFMYNLGFNLGPGEFYSFGGAATRSLDGSFFYRNPNTRNNVFTPGLTDDGDGRILVADLTEDKSGNCSTTVSITNGIADQAGLEALKADENCFAFNEIHPGGFTPRFGGTVVNTSLAGGYRNNSNKKFSYDFSLVYGQSSAAYELNNTVNASYGPDTLANFDVGEQEQIEIVFNADFVSQANVGLYSPLNIAYGFQYHNEAFEVKPGQDESWMDGGLGEQNFSVGSNGFQGFNPRTSGKADRTSTALYADFEVDITAAWLISTALRYEDFEDFGSTFNYKIASRFKLNDNLAIRGAASTGFRAPTVGQTNLQRTSTTVTNGQLSDRLLVLPNSPLAKRLGGKAVEPEESTNFSLGLIASLGPMDITLDWFSIEVDGRILQIEYKLEPDDKSFLAMIDPSTASSNVVEVSFYQNQVSTKTRGVDLVLALPYQKSSHLGEFSIAYNWTDTSVTDITNASFLTANEVKVIEDGWPSHRLIATLRHSLGDLSGLLRYSYYGEIKELFLNEVDDLFTTDDIGIVDLELTWRLPILSANYSLTVGAQNILDSQLKESPYAGLPGSLGVKYPLAHPAGFTGGSYYLKFSAEF